MTHEIAARLQKIAQGAALAQVAPSLAEGVRFFIAGLAPNAARLSLRFYFEDDFGAPAAAYRARVS